MIPKASIIYLLFSHLSRMKYEERIFTYLVRFEAATMFQFWWIYFTTFSLTVNLKCSLKLLWTKSHQGTTCSKGVPTYVDEEKHDKNNVRNKKKKDERDIQGISTLLIKLWDTVGSIRLCKRNKHIAHETVWKGKHVVVSRNHPFSYDMYPNNQVSANIWNEELDGATARADWILKLVTSVTLNLKRWA